MDYHFYESSLQPGASECFQSEFEVTPCCDHSLTFGEALPRSPRVTCGTECAGVQCWAVALTEITQLSSCWRQLKSFLSRTVSKGGWCYSQMLVSLSSCQSAACDLKRMSLHLLAHYISDTDSYGSLCQPVILHLYPLPDALCIHSRKGCLLCVCILWSKQ